MADRSYGLRVKFGPVQAADAFQLAKACRALGSDESKYLFFIKNLRGEFELLLDDESEVDQLLQEASRLSGVDIQTQPPEVAFRETISRAVEHDYTHKMLTGGSGQYARVKIRFEPQPRGAGFILESEVASDALPNEYESGVEKGLRASQITGVYAGYPTIDFKATLIDGAYHDTDSSEEAFEIAARACFREGMAKAGPILLQPIMRIEATTPEAFMGDVVAELIARYARIKSVNANKGPRSISALAPVRHLFGFRNRIQALTLGRSTLSVGFDNYDRFIDRPSPDDVHPGAAIGMRTA